MRIDHIIEAWKNEEVLEDLSAQETSTLPAHPAGAVADLSPEDLLAVSGGSTWACVTTSSWVCGVVVSVTVCDDIANWINENPNIGSERPPTLIQDKSMYCFAAETLIRTPSGHQAIGAFQPGDALLAFDQEHGAVREARVSAVDVHQGEFPVFDLDTRDDRVKVTAGHLFHDRDGWRPVEAFSGQEQGLDARERPVQLQLKPSRRSVSTVYNLRVEGLQTYFVGQQELLVRDH